MAIREKVSYFASPKLKKGNTKLYIKSQYDIRN